MDVMIEVKKKNQQTTFNCLCGKKCRFSIYSLLFFIISDVYDVFSI